MNKVINEFSSSATILTFLFGSGFLVSLYTLIKNKIFKKKITSEDAERIDESLSNFIDSIYGYFNGKTKKGFEGLSKVKGYESRLESFFNPNDTKKYPYFNKEKEKIMTNILLPENWYIGNYILAITHEVEFFRNKHIVPRDYDKNNKLAVTAYDEYGNDVTDQFPQTESKGILGFENGDILESGIHGTEKYNQYEKELSENLDNLKKLIVDYKKKYRQ